MLETKAIIGKDPKLIEAIMLAHRVAKRDVSVVILGETGTGKELIVREIHNASSRRTGPFVAYDCTAKPDTLIDSELFGIEKGVATDVNKRIGIIESAHTGTLFLDEIGDMPLSQQAKFLRVLEERSISNIGSRQPPKKVDFRLLVATNKDLQELMEEKKFRKDLFYRINVISIFLPPLRERRNDILALIRHFLTKYAGRSRRISHDAIKKLEAYDWPGNVRELANVIERALIFCHGKVISSEDISFDVCQKKIALCQRLKILLNKRQQLVYNYIQENNTITNREARELIKVSKNTINEDLAGMVNMGLIEKEGVGRGIFYVCKAL